MDEGTFHSSFCVTLFLVAMRKEDEIDVRRFG
jgi:hypothetical protein